jgi:hypothetical protein
VGGGGEGQESGRNWEQVLACASENERERARTSKRGERGKGGERERERIRNGDHCSEITHSVHVTLLVCLPIHGLPAYPWSNAPSYRVSSHPSYRSDTPTHTHTCVHQAQTWRMMSSEHCAFPIIPTLLKK